MSKHSHNFKNLTGQRFGRLVVIGESEMQQAQTRWKCKCDCGKEKDVPSPNLIKGRASSCGCLQAELRTLGRPKHGLYHCAEYRTWAGMKNRCFNPNDPKYPIYGGRGITVCERWHAVENFIADMGPKPSSKHSIERKNTDGIYEPGNCVWATNKEQCNNKRNNRLIELDGVTKNMTQWAERFGVKPRTVWQRLKNGWSERDAIYGRKAA